MKKKSRKINLNIRLDKQASISWYFWIAFVAYYAEVNERETGYSCDAVVACLIFQFL